MIDGILDIKTVDVNVIGVESRHRWEFWLLFLTEIQGWQNVSKTPIFIFRSQKCM